MRILMLLATLLLLGCVAQQEKTFEDPVETGTITKKFNTNDFSFSRENTSVVTAETVFPEIQHYNFSNVSTEDGNLIVYYFYSTNCVASHALAPEMARLEKEYENTLFLRHNLATPNGSRAYRDFSEQYNLSKDQMLVPQVLVNGTIITDRFNINKSLEDLLIAYS